MLVFLAGLGNLTKVQADGMFVAPKFVWDKHKDINEPTQKAIIVYDAGREDLILQVKYEGPVSEFGWLDSRAESADGSKRLDEMFLRTEPIHAEAFGSNPFMQSRPPAWI